MKKPFSIAVHGGAGTILRSSMTAEKEARYSAALKEALHAGSSILQAGGTAIDAIEAAVVVLEDNPLFNAGRGSVFTHSGRHEMDAAIMDGRTLEAGAAASLGNIKNPIRLARAVKERSGHVLLAGSEAEAFGKTLGLALEPDSYFFTEERHRQWIEAKDSDDYHLDHFVKENKFGTVGAVAMDHEGNLAAATSTGGMTNKRFGRIGDTPLIGAGTYANNNSCAVSCTGHGEFFIRAVVAYDVSCLMEYRGLSLKQACELVVKDKLVKLGGEGGLIAIDQHGNIELCFNSEGMYRGWQKEGTQPEVAIYRD